MSNANATGNDIRYPVPLRVQHSIVSSCCILLPCMTVYQVSIVCSAGLANILSNSRSRSRLKTLSFSPRPLTINSHFPPTFKSMDQFDPTIPLCAPGCSPRGIQARPALRFHMPTSANGKTQRLDVICVIFEWLHALIYRLIGIILLDLCMAAEGQRTIL